MRIKERLLSRKLAEKVSAKRGILNVGFDVFAPYRSVNDAAEAYPRLRGLQKGSTEVWYMKPSFFRDGIMGYKFLEKQGKLPDPRNLKKTHVLLGKIKERNLEEAYRLMQGDFWSPDGQANDLILGKGLRHTSMSMGDIFKVGNKVMMVDTFGFKQVPKKASRQGKFKGRLNVSGAKNYARRLSPKLRDYATAVIDWALNGPRGEYDRPRGYDYGVGRSDTLEIDESLAGFGIVASRKACQKRVAFKDYAKIMKAFDNLIDAIEATDEKDLSDVQVHDIATYYKRHLRAALADLGIR
jgi:hypothetical protein